MHKFHALQIQYFSVFGIPAEAVARTLRRRRPSLPWRTRGKNTTLGWRRFEQQKIHTFAMKSLDYFSPQKNSWSLSKNRRRLQFMLCRWLQTPECNFVLGTDKLQWPDPGLFQNCQTFLSNPGTSFPGSTSLMSNPSQLRSGFSRFFSVTILTIPKQSNWSGLVENHYFPGANSH